MSNQSQLLKANKDLLNYKLSIQNFGNVSLRMKNYFLIKPSGIDLNKIKSEELSKVSIKNNFNFNNKYKPSSDTATHKKLYQCFEEIGSIVHTHSLYATAWSQACKPIPCLGTTHADFFIKEIPVTNKLNKEEVKKNYEHNTALSIIKKLQKLKLKPLQCPGILVANHGPFSWGKDLNHAMKNAESLEYIARLAFLTLNINPKTLSVKKYLQDKHFERKNGRKAYYGQ